MAAILIGPNAGRAQIAESQRVYRELAELRAENDALRAENEALRAMQGMAAGTIEPGTLLELGAAPVAPTAPAPAAAPHVETSVIESLRGIAIESQSSVATAPIGSMASGERRAVGFSTADGYLRALAQGVKAATADLYRDELRRKYGYSATQIAALKISIIADDGRPVGPGITHAARGPSYADMTPQQRAQQRRVGAPVVPPGVPTIIPQRAPRVLAGPTARGPAQIPGVTALSAPFVNKDGCTVQLITRPPPGGPVSGAGGGTQQGPPGPRQLAAGAPQRPAAPPIGSTFTSPDGSSVKLMGPAIGRGAQPAPGTRAAPRIQLSAPQPPSEPAEVELVDGPPPGLASSGDDAVDRFSLLELD